MGERKEEEVTDLTVSLHPCRSSDGPHHLPALQPAPHIRPAWKESREHVDRATGLTGFASDDVHAGSVRLILRVEPPRKNQEMVSAMVSMNLYPGNSQGRVHWAEEFTARQML